MALAALLLIPPALLPIGPAPSRRVALQGAASLASGLLLQPLGAPPAAHAAEAKSRRPTIALAGGGVFFWWQAGGVHAFEPNTLCTPTHTRALPPQRAFCARGSARLARQAVQAERRAVPRRIDRRADGHSRRVGVQHGPGIPHGRQAQQRRGILGQRRVGFARRVGRLHSQLARCLPASRRERVRRRDRAEIVYARGAWRVPYSSSPLSQPM